MQWLSHPSDLAYTFSLQEVLWMLALGAVLEGLMEPWWRERLEHHTPAHGSDSSARVRALRFAITTLIWTPVCIELANLWDHLLVHGHLQEYLQQPMHLQRDVLHEFGFDLTRGGDHRLIERQEASLGEDLSATKTWETIASGFMRLLPPPLRPMARQLSNAGSWTLLDQLQL